MACSQGPIGSFYLQHGHSAAKLTVARTLSVVLSVLQPTMHVKLPSAATFSGSPNSAIFNTVLLANPLIMTNGTSGQLVEVGSFVLIDLPYVVDHSASRPDLENLLR